MHGDRLQWAQFGGLLVLGILAAWTLREVAAMSAAAEVKNRREEPNMQSFKETVTVTADPTRKIEVLTVRNAGESEADWIARHNAAVVAAKGA